MLIPTLEEPLKIQLASASPYHWPCQFQYNGLVNRVITVGMETVWYQQHASHLQRQILPMLLLNVQPASLSHQGYVPDRAPSFK